MGVLAIWRYPVKAMLGQLVRSARVGAGGIEGDRRWVVADAATGERIASKRGPTDVRLRECRAELRADGELVVTLPDGRTTAMGARAVSEALSDLLSRRVVLEEHRGTGSGFVCTGGHHDFAPLHLLTTRSLAHMRAVAPASDWDVRRFRPNVVLDDGEVPTELSERRLLGAELGAPSGLRMYVGLPTPRCVVPTRGREELPRDPALLRQIATESRWSLGPFGRPACLGTYAEVTATGALEEDDRLSVAARRQPSADAVVAATVERVIRGSL